MSDLLDFLNKCDAMRRYVLFAVAATLIAFAGLASEVRADSAKQPLQTESDRAADEERERTLRGLIDELDKIMQPPYDKKPGSEVRAVYLMAKEQMVRGGLAWNILDNGEKEMYAAFVPAQEGREPRIEVNHALIDSARAQPTLAMTMIMHEMKHARDEARPRLFYHRGEVQGVHEKPPGALHVRDGLALYRSSLHPGLPLAAV
jgi:hypothetical protein